MAGFTTHYIFGRDMINELKDESVIQLIKKYRKVYNLGLQGPDIFFYNLFIVIGSDKYKFGKIMHRSKTNEFFNNAINYINSINCTLNINNRIKKEILMVYFYGLLAHYTLDMHVHPYVYYRSGYSPDKDNSEESFGMHSFIEINIDKKYLTEKMQILPSKFYQNKTVNISKNEKKHIESFLGYCIIKTYYKNKEYNKNFVAFVNLQMKLSIYIYRLFLYILHDRYGIKRKCIQYIEKNIIGHIYISNIILTNDLKDTVDSMNLKREEWNNPWDMDKKSKDSFHDLYKKAGSFYKILISDINDCKGDNRFINENKIKHILYMINNRSYHTGMDCDI